MDRERDGLPLTTLREIRILKSLKDMRHPNIVLLKDVVVGSKADSMFLVFEYVAHDMARLLDSMRTPFTISEVKCLVIQLLKAVAFLHDHWIIHRDIKLSNLLLSNNGEVKLADFGLARTFGSPPKPCTPKVVTLWYRAPELLLGNRNYTTAIDMWSVGCILGELLVHAPLLPGKTDIQQLDMIFQLLGTPTDKIWPGFSSLPSFKSIKLPHQPYNNLKQKFPQLSQHGIDLLNRLLTYDPKKRITAREALTHPFFAEKPLAKEPSMLPSFPELHENIKATSRKRRISDEPENCGRPDRRDLVEERFGKAFGEVFERELLQKVTQREELPSMARTNEYGAVPYAYADKRRHR